MSSANYISTKLPITDAVNLLILHGQPRSAIIGQLIASVRQLLGNPRIILLDEAGDGVMTGLVMGNEALIENAADFAESNGWDIIDVPDDKGETLQ